MRSDAKEVGIGKAVPLAHCENLDAAREDRPRTRQSIHRIWYIKACSLMILRPALCRTTANHHDFKQQDARPVPKGTILSTGRAQPPP